MKSDQLKKKLTAFALAASLMLLTSCLSAKPVERVSASGWIHLQKGQTFKAPREMLLAEEYVVQELQQELIDTLEAINRAAATKALE